VSCGLIRLDRRVDTRGHVVELVPLSVELVPLSVEQWSANANGRFCRHRFNLLPGIM
jgi:hypothetical protein